MCCWVERRDGLLRVLAVQQPLRLHYVECRQPPTIPTPRHVWWGAMAAGQPCPNLQPLASAPNPMVTFIPTIFHTRTQCLCSMDHTCILGLRGAAMTEVCSHHPAGVCAHRPWLRDNTATCTSHTHPIATPSHPELECEVPQTVAPTQLRI
jgi:hypothetical protein